MESEIYIDIACDTPPGDKWTATRVHRQARSSSQPFITSADVNRDENNGRRRKKDDPAQRRAVFASRAPRNFISRDPPIPFRASWFRFRARSKDNSFARRV